jgi:hypothetical protein
MGGGGGEADVIVIRIGDGAGTGEEIAVTQDIWTLLRWYEQVFSPGRAFQDLVLLGPRPSCQLESYGAKSMTS